MPDSELSTVVVQNSKEAFLSKLKDAVLKYGVTNLAAKTGMGRTHIYKILTPGRANPTLDSLIKIAAVLGIDIELRGGCDGQPPLIYPGVWPAGDGIEVD